MSTGMIVARKKPEPEQGHQSSARGSHIHSRVSDEYKAWLDALVQHDADRRRAKASLSDTLDQALVAYAKRIGFTEPPPKR